MSDVLRILVVFLLVLGNSVFVAAEYALVTARRTRLEQRNFTEPVSAMRREASSWDVRDESVTITPAREKALTATHTRSSSAPNEWSS